MFEGQIPAELIKPWGVISPTGVFMGTGSGLTLAHAETRKPATISEFGTEVNGESANRAERNRLLDEVAPIWRNRERVLTNPNATAQQRDAAVRVLLDSARLLRPFNGGFQKEEKGVRGVMGSWEPYGPPTSIASAGDLPAGGIGVTCSSSADPCARARADQEVGFSVPNPDDPFLPQPTDLYFRASTGSSVSKAAGQSSLAIAYSLDPLDLTWSGTTPTLDFVLDPALAISVSGDLPGFAALNVRISYVNDPPSEDPFEELLETATLLLDVSILVHTDGTDPQLHVLVESPSNPAAAATLESFIADHFVADANGLFGFDEDPLALRLAVNTSLGVDGPAATTRFFIDGSAGIVSAPEVRTGLLVASGLLAVLVREASRRTREFPLD